LQWIYKVVAVWYNVMFITYPVIAVSHQWPGSTLRSFRAPTEERSEMLRWQCFPMGTLNETEISTTEDSLKIYKN
jgi:hypothetical protein